MALRYPIAVLLAYGVFLLFLRGWLSQRLRERPSSFDTLDLIDVATDAGPRAEPPPLTSGGGQFGGGGAGGSFDGPVPAPSSAPCMVGADAPSTTGTSLGGALAEAVGDDLWPLVLVIGLVVGAAVAVGTIVYAAPVLLAEILLDGLIVAGILRRLRGVDPQHWTTVALRRSWMPVVGLAALLAIGGWAATLMVPGADSIGDLFRA